VAAFRDLLTDLGVNATVRRNRGVEIDAACGQLAARAGPGAGNADRLSIGRRPDSLASVPN
jgi:hypothetical protein